MTNPPMTDRHLEGGGRITRPWFETAARAAYQGAGIFAVELHHPALDDGDKVYLAQLARRIGLHGKAPVPPRQKRTQDQINASAGGRKSARMRAEQVFKATE